MQNENIICFAKDWHEDPTSNNHVMMELARGNRVLWLNSVATRTPKLTSKRDIGKIFKKLASFARGAKEERPNLWIYTPIVLPFPHSRLARALNRKILNLSLRILRRKLGMREFQLWTFLPNTADYVGTLGESVSVYYCVDEWSKFSYVDGPKIVASEKELCRRANVIFATAKSLVDARLPINPHTHLARHGVDQPRFARALDDDLKIPDELAKLPKPVVGFCGTFQDWVDLDLLVHLAKKHPEWSIVLIGNKRVDLSAVESIANIHYLGHRNHADLPAYFKGFCVGLISQKVNELTLHMNPIKLREYLSAGLPVVATALPEVQAYDGLVRIGRTYEEFEQAVVDSIAEDTPELRRKRSDAMRGETWREKVDQLGTQVLSVKAELCNPNRS